MASAYLFAMLAATPSKSREIALIANPEFEADRVAGHRARRLIDGGNPAFSDPFLVMAEDWAPRDAFSRHPHRGIETVTLVLDGALEHEALGSGSFSFPLHEPLKSGFDKPSEMPRNLSFSRDMHPFWFRPSGGSRQQTACFRQQAGRICDYCSRSMASLGQQGRTACR